MKWWHEKKAGVLGRNSKSTPTGVILDQMGEARPLPIGRAEFDAWSDRIISGALLPADHASQKFALADSLLHLGPTESHKPDAYFIHLLRKFAVNQVAHEMRQELKEAHTRAAATLTAVPDSGATSAK
jgi:hypothetical protein